MIAFTIVVWLLCAVLCYYLGQDKGIGPVPCLLIGFFGSIIGVIIVLCLPKAVQPDEQWEQENVRLSQSRVSIADELKKWHDLKNSGAITEKEFEDKKKQLLWQQQL